MNMKSFDLEFVSHDSNNLITMEYNVYDNCPIDLDVILVNGDYPSITNEDRLDYIQEGYEVIQSYVNKFKAYPWD